MAKYRAELPEMQSAPFLTDAGLESTLNLSRRTGLAVLRGLRTAAR